MTTDTQAIKTRLAINRDGDLVSLGIYTRQLSQKL